MRLFSPQQLLSSLESADPGSMPTNHSRINTSKMSRICIKTNDFNPIRFCTSKPVHPRQKTNNFKSTGINTYAFLSLTPLESGFPKEPGGHSRHRNPQARQPCRYCRRFQPGQFRFFACPSLPPRSILSAYREDGNGRTIAESGTWCQNRAIGGNSSAHAGV